MADETEPKAPKPAIPASHSALTSARFNRDDVRVEQSKTAFNGFFDLCVLTLKHRLFGGGWSRSIEREVFTKTEAAGAILYDAKHDLIGLVEQFRAGALASEYGPWCLEVVAGMLEPGESPEELILREIKEEADLTPDTLHKITAYYSTPGACNEKIHLYCAQCDLTQAGGVHGLDSENEDILLSIFNAQEVLETMLESRANNAATVIALQWLAANRARLRSS